MKTPREGSILVWDAPVRVFHWLLVLCFAGAFVTAESERLRLLHVTLGYTAGGLVVFRLLWGLVGTRHARFAAFVRGPRAVVRYLASLPRARPEHHVGHNPAGALAIVAMLVAVTTIVASGLAVYNDLGGQVFEELHEGAANLMLAIVGLHVAAVWWTGRRHRENLVGSMITGRKPGRPEDGIRGAWRTVALVMVVAVLGFWSWQWHQAPALELAAGTSAARGHDDD